jgi:hypothetical protein
MMVTVEQLVEWRLAGETEVVAETCPGAALSTTNPTWDPDSNPDPNRLSYEMAFSFIFIKENDVLGGGLNFCW